MLDTAKWNAKWIIEKFRNEDYGIGKPYAVEVIPGNLLLNEGIGEMLDILCGLGTPTIFNNANARIGVGDSATAADPSQTGLVAAVNKTYKAMEAGYPLRVQQTVSFKSVFGPTDANYAWEEYSIDNGNVANKNLNRKVISKGTKSNTDTWTITLEITLS